jgi:hypothetical protein
MTNLINYLKNPIKSINNYISYCQNKSNEKYSETLSLLENILEESKQSQKDVLIAKKCNSSLSTRTDYETTFFIYISKGDLVENNTNKMKLLGHSLHIIDETLQPVVVPKEKYISVIKKYNLDASKIKGAILQANLELNIKN